MHSSRRDYRKHHSPVRSYHCSSHHHYYQCSFSEVLNFSIFMTIWNGPSESRTWGSSWNEGMENCYGEEYVVPLEREREGEFFFIKSPWRPQQGKAMGAFRPLHVHSHLSTEIFWLGYLFISTYRSTLCKEIAWASHPLKPSMGCWHQRTQFPPHPLHCKSPWGLGTMLISFTSDVQSLTPWGTHSTSQFTFVRQMCSLGCPGISPFSIPDCRLQPSPLIVRSPHYCPTLASQANHGENARIYPILCFSSIHP